MGLFNWFNKQRRNDPVYSCIVFKRQGCPHIDGISCDMKSCKILAEYQLRELEQQLDITLKYRL